MICIKRIFSIFGYKDTPLLLNAICIALSTLAYLVIVLINIAYLILQQPVPTDSSERLKYIFIPSNSFSIIFLFFAF